MKSWVQTLLLFAILGAIGVAGLGQSLQGIDRLEMRQDPARVEELPPRLRRALWTINPRGVFDSTAVDLDGCARIYLVSNVHAKNVPLKFQAQFALAPAAIRARKYPLEDEVFSGLEHGAGVILHGTQVRKQKVALRELKAHAEDRGYQLIVERRAGMTIVRRAGA